jgi:hypothetical protein
MAIRLTVPLIKQFDNATCWHAAARMLWAYKYRQSISPLPKKLKQAERGLSTYEIPDLAGDVGLKPIPDACRIYTAAMLESLISQYGPLFAPGFFMRDYPNSAHVIVLTGADAEGGTRALAGKIYYNDPWDAKEHEASIEWFTTRRSKTDESEGHYYQPVLWYLP